MLRTATCLIRLSSPSSFRSSIRLQLRNMASSLKSANSARIAVCQLTCTSKKDENFEIASRLIAQARQSNAKMVFLPECVDFGGERKDQVWELAEGLDGPLISAYCKLATENKLWISLGSMHIRPESVSPDTTPVGPKKIRNTHILISSKGQVAGTYDKIHLFDVDIPAFRIKESDFAQKGTHLTAPIDTPIGQVGLGICYDMRFPEMAIALAKAGAQVLTYPSAFTVSTGYSHWESLLRARAIESQCYVVAAAQVGQHNPKRSSYGHSVVVDPWGAVIAQASDKTNQVIYADIDLDYIKTVRMGMPVANHRRPDIYGECTGLFSSPDIDSQETYQFGQVEVSKAQLFYKTHLTMAFVNKMPVLNGHVVVAPLRNDAIRLAQLSNDEITDLFTVVAKVQSAVENEYQAKDSTISIQDGTLAGRSIDHLHVHVLPRHEGDFKNDNDVYNELQNPNPKKQTRTMEEMAEEASKLRKYFH